MIKKKISLNEIKKYLKRSGFTIIKRENKKSSPFAISSLNVISKTALSCLAIISFFYISPHIIDFTSKSLLSSKEFKNNSQDTFQKTLKKENVVKLDESLNEKYLFDDVDFDDLPTDVVRLSASTIQQLFKDTNYNLQDVRKKKLVKPVSLSLLPEEIKSIENIQERKNLFIQIILPLVIAENNNIKLDRRKLFRFLNKSRNSLVEKKWIEKKFKQYGVKNNDLLTLKVRMDEIPVSMTIAQAAKETGWGTSRFAQEGNALFGQWTWSGEGIKPAGAEVNTTHKVMKFKILQASVKAYQRNLNTHSSYRDFRSTRAELREKGKKLDSVILTDHLDKYAETGKEYVKTLQKIIRQNNLSDFDDAKLLPSSIDLESLI
tara:strand:- start:495 stop:1622 length:1128 start_codon:yes stop_codon:yes gene_type:complete